MRQVERPEERQPAPAAPELQQLRPAVGLWRRGPASAEPKRWHDRLDVDSGCIISLVQSHYGISGTKEMA